LANASRVVACAAAEISQSFFMIAGSSGFERRITNGETVLVIAGGRMGAVRVEQR
jgi:hypothetical protein